MSTPNDANAELLCERTGAVAVLRLHRPAVRNALGSGLVGALSDTLTALNNDAGVRAAVLTGAPPGFCAGSDLKELAGLPAQEMMRHEARTGLTAGAIQQLDLPVIAAVEGFAIGGGFLLATGCDLVVTAEDAHWHLPEVGLGWVPPWGLRGLLDRVGMSTAKRLVWGMAPLTGREAQLTGVADELVAPGRALPRALDLARRLAALPPHAVSSAKHTLAQVGAESARLLDERATRAFGENCRTDTARVSMLGFAHASRERRR
jgi:enoyl-CoA hydratase/carnithine racemase